MAFTPVIPTTGLAGWNFLQQTLPRQEEIFSQSPEVSRELEYFNENIGNVKTLDDFMGDRRLLSVALGAFGLGDEIDKGAFVRKVLEEGVTESTAFARRLGNADYLAFAERFDFTNGDLKLFQTNIDDIMADYERQSFEVEVGNVDETMRLALNFERKIADYVGQGSTESGGWFQLMASVPMRTVLESAFNLPSSFANLDIDKQREIFSDKMNAKYGDKSIESFSDPEVVADLIQNYLLREEIDAGPTALTTGATALSLLSSASSGFGSSSLLNIILSNG
ncbi:uncharacterized protein DUF1217 [Litorimonas taeanensis]|uniref:Uncharacterized protein DUF1217 n=1 Tax=Litorimonas taeanensis TaxID=568099 RepID=A0A420WMM7_9PROT|nr:DUF1217 domain-containing protein [Litorimonas taeanensis]RKQ72145.1 uncharacterized protein DUF1217 [Litorimonas taeanensis]